MEIEEKICNALQKHFVGIEIEEAAWPKIYKAVQIKYEKTGESIDSMVESLAYQYKTWNEFKKIKAAKCSS